MFKALTATESRILFALGKFKFLTVSHMMKLGIMSHRNHLNTNLKKLRERGKPLVHSLVFGVHPQIGKLENFHCLTKYGKQLLLDFAGNEMEAVKAPIGLQSLFVHDYQHRKFTIDFHVCVEKWINAHPDYSLDLFDRYFDKVGNNRRSKSLTSLTKLPLPNNQHLFADGIFIVSDPDSNLSLFCFEMYNGKDTKRVIKQLTSHKEAIKTGSPSEKFGLNKLGKSNRVLCVFEEESCMKAVLTRLNTKSAFANYSNHFLFKPLAQVAPENIFQDWTNLNGEHIAIFTP